jgi:hypothetical protein
MIAHRLSAMQNVARLRSSAKSGNAMCAKYIAAASQGGRELNGMKTVSRGIIPLQLLLSGHATDLVVNFLHVVTTCRATVWTTIGAMQ